MSTKKKLIAGIAILVAAILFSVFVVPKNRNVPVAEKPTTAEETTTTVESTADETTTDWFGMDWTTAPYIETTAATTAATTRTTSKTTPLRTTTTVPRPATTRSSSTTRAASTTKPPAATTRRPTTTRAPSTSRQTTTTAKPTTAADTLITYGINYGKNIGLTYRPQLTQGGEAVSGATQAQIRAKLDQAKAAGATQFNVWRQGGAVYIATGR